jgi:hypothetical protein
MAGSVGALPAFRFRGCYKRTSARRPMLATTPKSSSGTEGGYALVSQRKLAVYLAPSTSAGVANFFNNLTHFFLAGMLRMLQYFSK